MYSTIGSVDQSSLVENRGLNDVARDADRAFNAYASNPNDQKAERAQSSQQQGEWYFESRAEAAAVLLRRTAHCTGAKHFAAGGITLHVNDLVLDEGGRELPSALRLEVKLLGAVRSFDISPSSTTRGTVRLGQIVNYEIEPDVLPDQMAALPFCEFRLYATHEKSTASAVRVRVNGVAEEHAASAAAWRDDELLGTAQHDLASQSADVVNLPLRLERAASSRARGDASEPLGDLLVSVVAERSTGADHRRAEGGYGAGSCSGYGSGYGAGDADAAGSLRSAPSSRQPAWRPGGSVRHHSHAGPTLVDDSTPHPGAAAYRSLPPRPSTAASVASSRLASRPPSRGPGSIAGSRAGSLHGSRVRGAGSVVSAGGNSASARRGCVETPVGFQYKSIPTRYIAPQTFQPTDDNARCVPRAHTHQRPPTALSHRPQPTTPCTQ